MKRSSGLEVAVSLGTDWVTFDQIIGKRSSVKQLFDLRFKKKSGRPWTQTIYQGTYTFQSRFNDKDTYFLLLGFEQNDLPICMPEAQTEVAFTFCMNKNCIIVLCAFCVFPLHI